MWCGPKALGMYKVAVLLIAAGGLVSCGFTLFVLEGDATAAAAAASPDQAAVWTDAGELFTLGNGNSGRLGHGGTEHVPVPRLVQALVWKVVAQRHVLVAQRCGPRSAISSPLGMESMGNWATEGNGMSLCRSWSRH
jgi:hypothetical protein